jgi:hypothetical protein
MEIALEIFAGLRPSTPHLTPLAFVYSADCTEGVPLLVLPKEGGRIRDFPKLCK